MKFRLISRFGDGLGLAWALQTAGHQVDFFITEPPGPHLYEGMVKRVHRWNDGLTPETVVLFDMVGHGKIADSLRAAGHHVYGGGALNDQLELDRNFGRQLAKNSGINVPPTETFSDFTEGARSIVGKEGGWVLRPAANTPAPFTYAAASTEEMRIMLGHFAATQPAGDFTLQPQTPGVEVNIECWYTHGEPLPATINSTLESTRFLAGGLGPRTGCMGSVAWFWKNRTNKLYRLTHEKIQPFLRRYGYDGPLNVRVIIAESDRRPVFLDFTARFGYNAIYALCEDLGVDLAELLAGVACGRPVECRPSFQWCGALRITSPPFPYRIPDTFTGKPIAGVDPTDGHFWPLDAFASGGRLLTAGGDGVVCELTARADTTESLAAKLYGQAERLILADKQYRIDVVDRARSAIEQLGAWKYLKPAKREVANA